MKVRKYLIGAVVVLLLVPSAFAHRIDGDITIVGDPFVRSDSGDFATLAPVGSMVTSATSWWFIVTKPSSFLLTVKGFNFSLTSSTIVSKTTGSLKATGAGMTSGNGFDATAGDWTFTNGGKGAVFNFTAGPSAVLPPTVPDSGSGFGLISIALAALGGASYLRSIRSA